MTTEFQPRERLPFYLPENWLPIDFDTAAGSGSFINYPTAQTANISFPGTILCSNLQSFAPSAAMNLFNNSTSGNIQIANANTFTGGIVINANATAPVANETIIGTSARALVAPLFRTSEIYGTGAFAGQVEVKADLQVANGYGLYSNYLEQYTGGILTIGGVNGARLDIGTGASRGDAINIGTNMVATALIDIGSTASWINIFGKLQSGFQLNYLASTYSGVDNYLGGYKEGTYAPASPSLSLNTTQQRIVGSIPSLLSVGVYQLNIHTTLASSVLNPYLLFQVYSKPALPAWVNGALRTTGTGSLSLLKLNRNPTTAVADLYTLDMSGLLVVSTKAYYAIVVGNADLTVSQNLTYIDTFMSVTRVG